MNAILGILETAVKAGEMIEVMDQGVEPTVFKLADLADDYIALQIPAYGALRDACGAVSKCKAALSRTRNELFLDVAKITGIYQAIKVLVRVWQMIPKAARVVLGKVTEIGLNALGAAKDVITSLVALDPAAMWEAAKVGLNLVASSGKLIFDLAQKGVKLLKDLFNKYLSAVLGPIESVPLLGPLLSGSLDVLGDAWELGEEAIDALSNPGDSGLAVAGSLTGVAPALGDFMETFNPL